MDDMKKKDETGIRKAYVEVLADFTADGRMFPLMIIWEDGRRYRIEEVCDCRRAASLKAGGTGLRYTCRISGANHYLFYEENNRWFVEAKMQS